MRAFRRDARLRALLLLLLLGVTPLAGLDHERAAQSSDQVDPIAVPAPPNTLDPSGTGVLARAGCVLCGAAFLAAGGTTILGVAVAAVVFPELAAACGATCAYAFG